MNNFLEFSVLPVLLLIVLLVVFVLILIMTMTIKSNSSNRLHYKKQNALFTKTEINFLKTLEKIVTNPSVAIFGKVRMADIITPQKTTNSKGWWQLFAKITSKHVDYVLCDRGDYSVICVIELNDKSHNTTKAKQRDSFVRKAYQSAGIELLEIKASRYYDVNKVIMQFSKEVRIKIV
jgi:hypothetical protein